MKPNLMFSALPRAIGGLLLLLALGGRASSAPLAAGASSPPNILVLIADDLSRDYLGCYGNVGMHTPNLDGLAREGLRFNRAYVASAQCSPSRSAIFAGRTPHAIGTSRLHAELRPSVPTIVEPLKRKGYFTGIYRKNHLGDEFLQRLDFYGGPREPFTSFFERLPAGRPFFLWLGFTDPHRGPNNYDHIKGKAPRAHDPAQMRVPPFLPDTPAMREDLALHCDAIGRLDQECGALLALLRQRGLADNTMVVFFGDNGMPYPRAKATCYEPGINVPLLIRWPGRTKPGTVTDELVSTLDLATTWLEAAGLPALQPTEGRSLVPLLTGQPHEARRYVFAERNWHDTWDPSRAIVSDRYALICNFRPEVSYRGTLDHESAPPWAILAAERQAGRLRPELEPLFRSPRPPVEFYDLQNDPNEFTNLADDPALAGPRDAMLLALDQWMRDTNDFLPPPARFSALRGKKITVPVMLDGPLPK